ncbi:hypothetical protein U9M48_006998 [Paspalum notatum var. saurae]|uniref:SWIM-type domain-containing protein n=1 Tax=Paspalum notatum var. saurae TaxID=547442 RepID=A0AAQ3SKW7_PASNO
MRWGTYEASYHNLPRVLNTLCERNPGSYFEIKHYNLPHDPTKHVLRRAFFVLGACINAFQDRRPVICIDGTFLTGRYKGTMPTAIAADGNNRVRTGTARYWFLERIKSCIVRDRRDVRVIHDRHGGIMQAVQDLREGSVQRQRTPKWVDLKSRWCMRHMGANFRSGSRRPCSRNQEKKFNVLWKKLDEHTKKRGAELRSRGVNAEDEEPIAMENVGVDGPNAWSFDQVFFEWIEHEPKEKWALLHDEGGARYGIMTTNLAEVYNRVLRGERSMPLVGIVEFYIYRTTQYFRERYPKAEKVFKDHRLIYGQKFFEYMDKANKKAAGHRVRNMGVAEHRFEVLCRDKGRRGGNHERHVQECVLYNNHCVCSCHKPRLYHRPCTHVIAACQEAGGLNAHMFVSPYYMKDAIYHTWKSEIYGFAMVGNFTEIPMVPPISYPILTPT